MNEVTLYGCNTLFITFIVNNHMKKKRVLVGMSWGVDSAVSAYLLLQQWYEVIAWFMKNYADESNPNCHTREDRNMALKVSQFLGIKTFVIFDFREEYDKQIIQYIYESYQAWLTPNPDILCNTEVKFKLFLEKGLELWCDYVATWHYAQIFQREDGIYTLHKWIDDNKDQTYFLSGLNQYQLRHSIFPIWHMHKPDVRTLAQKIWLPNADRKDSQWLCFIGKVDMKTFLAQSLPKVSGNIVDTQWNILWEHDGVHFYTLGQRQWLWLSGGPRYVTHRDIQTNVLTVWRELAPQMYTHTIYIKNIHRTSGSASSLPRSGTVKIRYRQEDQTCVLSQDATNPDIYIITTEQKQRAATPWQTAVFYEWDVLVGSGVIVYSKPT